MDQFLNDNEQSRGDIGLSFYNEEVDLGKKNQDDDLNDYKFINVKSVTINQNPTSDHEVANKKCVDDSIGDGNVLSFIQTLQNYLKVSVGNDT